MRWWEKGFIVEGIGFSSFEKGWAASKLRSFWESDEELAIGTISVDVLYSLFCTIVGEYGGMTVGSSLTMMLPCCASKLL